MPACYDVPMSTASLLWIAAVIIAVVGVVAIVRGAVLAGIVLLLVAALVGPGGISIYR